jgi:catechol 2,3-dioxygenase-like lactoylglutathione lyase family enzyme
MGTIDGRLSRAAASPLAMICVAQGGLLYMQSTITDLFAGVPVSDLDAGIDWYTRFFGRPPDHRMGEEMLWEIDEHATLFIEPNATHAGAGRITLAVTGLDGLLERLAAQGIGHEPIETYSNGVRHVNVPDPDGNAIAFAEPPAAAIQ